MKRSVLIVLASVLAALGLAVAGTARTAHASSTYYMSPTGSDSNAGTMASPWLTLKNSLPKLAAGDTLLLENGTYFENNLTVNEHGTSAAPITVANAPGASPKVDGGVPDFYTTGAGKWTLADAASDTYKSVGTYTAGNGFTGAWLDDLDVQLTQYSSLADLESTDYGPLASGTAVYEGPGIMLNTDGHLYVRLDPNPNDLFDSAGNPVSDPISDHNPNDNVMSVYFNSNIAKFSGASWLTFRGITFEGPEFAFDTSTTGSTNITLAGDTIRYGTYGLNTRAGSSAFTVTGDTFDGGFPSWLYWSDAKDAHDEDEAYPEFQSDAITQDSAGLVSSQITNNVIRDGMEGLLVKDGSTSDQITGNYFVREHDDAVQFSQGAGGGTGGVEFADNMMFNVAGGIGESFTTGTPAGPIYVHNNVLDDSHLMRIGRPGNMYSTPLTQWDVFNPFTKHSGSPTLDMYLYNNTFVTQRSASFPTNAMGPSFTASANKKVYDNIFYGLTQQTAQRDDETSSGASYDGNAYWRDVEGSTYQLFLNFANSTNYNSVTALQGAATGWEASAIQSDPGFSTANIASATFNPADPSALWKNYVPAAGSSELTQGFTLSSSWPGATADAGFRGATAGWLPGGLAGQVAGTMTSATLTVPTTIPAGSLITVGVSDKTAARTFAVTDTGGNSYALDNSRTGSSPFSYQLHSLTTAQLNPGDTITVTWGGTSDDVAVQAPWYITGYGTVTADLAKNGHGTGTALSTGNATATGHALELVTGLGGPRMASTGGYTEDSADGYTQAAFTGDTAQSQGTAYRYAPATAVFDYKPSIGVSSSWADLMTTYTGS